MNEAFIVGRSAERALVALREIVMAEETEPIIDMYERAAWMSGATRPETQAVASKARQDRDELLQIGRDIRGLIAESNTTHNRLCAEVRVCGQVNRIMDESR